MLVSKCLKTLNSIRSIRLKNHLVLSCLKIRGKRDILYQYNYNFKCLNREEIYNECIKNGLSPSAISSNDWIFDLNVSK